eukprot:CAMPEP_0180706326 /NCGR_PEP_ID=MMETSP1038_2-20121128/8143_1 /TAXON_ID=632150 /ORGANISM="Azadinium spinosum, Strain 3D9" /LENGTH=138 /DNA_ID=CAMNT_0022738245 /DNA_START=18 /DNA_END=430 /DNA_ORIENTATION=+
MQLVLRQYAEATGESFDELRQKQEAILFKLDQAPQVPRPSRQQRMRTLRGSFANGSSDSKHLIPLIYIESPQQAVKNVGMALNAGVSGVWLVNGGHATSPSQAVSANPTPARVSLRAMPGPENAEGHAQLRALKEAFA